MVIFLKRTLFIFVLLFLLLLPFHVLAKHNTSRDNADAVEPFSDVPSNHRNFEAIEALRQNSLVKGYGDGTFHPARLVKRAEAATMITRALDPQNPDPDAGRYKNCFQDTTGQWFAKYVCFGKANLWLKGYHDTQLFRPDSNVVVSEMLRMAIDAFKIGIQAPILLYKHKWDIPRGYQLEPEKFKGQPTQWWETYLVTARFWNFLDVTPEAGKMMSRGEVAEIIYRVAKHKKIL